VKAKSSKTKAIAFILIEFALPILLGLIHPTLEDETSAYFAAWAIVRVVKQEEEQDKRMGRV
jgi:hypothetical protein